MSIILFVLFVLLSLAVLANIGSSKTSKYVCNFLESGPCINCNGKILYVEISAFHRHINDLLGIVKPIRICYTLKEIPPPYVTMSYLQNRPIHEKMKVPYSKERIYYFKILPFNGEREIANFILHLKNEHCQS